jgi:arsenate reductase (thioredoxin)
MAEVNFYKPLEKTIQSLTNSFESISSKRKELLKPLTDFVELKVKANKNADLIFICTHNSRRSHICQIWTQAAAAYYQIKNVKSYSGGTEVTAFNPRAVKTLQEVGFQIKATSEGQNPVYAVRFSDDGREIRAFSKMYDSPPNPSAGFAAVMSCSHAEKNCPFVPGMQTKISLPYSDPREFDDTPKEAPKYSHSVKEIGSEIFYAFSQIRL